MSTILSANHYGKAEVRLVAVDRSAPEHTFSDLTVTITLSGDLDAVYVDGDNAKLVLTDSQKNTVYALAKEAPIGDIESFAMRLARHFIAEYSQISGARIQIDAEEWERIDVSGQPHPYAFRSPGSAVRSTVVVCDTEGEWVLSGLRGLIVMKTAGTEFRGYVRDRFTTLPSTHQQLLSTTIAARWRHAAADATTDFNASFFSVRATLLELFATTESTSLQQTLYAMGSAVIDGHPEVVEARLSLPNRHHYLVDLTPFGLSNDSEIFRAEDRPYGLIEATVSRDDAPPAGPAWDSHPLIS